MCPLERDSVWKEFAGCGHMRNPPRIISGILGPFPETFPPMKFCSFFANQRFGCKSIDLVARQSLAQLWASLAAHPASAKIAGYAVDPPPLMDLKVPASTRE
ncbi:hypothetical protein ASJ83_05495 [Methanocorpusculum parvum]|uniref:Uncharacterized protein n=1 Tax=Methanocorpusculum parvum TaxID=2193 RepID=A0AAX0Q8V2_9EURY|nr:hypothetical protein ASJ83_05495 [Methanocorpusculum parvum]